MKSIFTVCFLIICASSVFGQITPPHYYFQSPYGGATNVYFINPNFKRSQVLYTQQDLANMVSPINSSIEIDTLFLRYGVGSFLAPGPYPYQYTGLQIRMAHTSSISLNSMLDDNFDIDPGIVVLDIPGEFTLNYVVQPDADSALEQAEEVWTAIPLSTAFSYNGEDNILIEVTFENLVIPFNTSGLQMDFSASAEMAAVGESIDATTASVILSRPYIGFAGSSCPSLTTDITATICSGNSYSFQGQNLVQSGIYRDTLSTFTGCDSILELNLTVSDINVTATSVYDYNGYEVSCPDNNDGSLEAIVNNGTSPYFFNWSTGDNAPILPWLEAGTYTVTVIDANGCTGADTAVLMAPPMLELNLQSKPANCTDEQSGQIEVLASGGVGPYTYRLNNSIIQSIPLFDSLAFGDYELQIIDQNGCTRLEESTVLSAEGFNLNISPINSFVNLGEAIRPNVNAGTFFIDSIQWTPTEGLSCSDCLEPEISPLRTTTYTLQVIDEFGCTASASLDIEVSTNRQVYFPTAFSPDFDGINDIFTAYGGPATASISELKVFDRWGSLVYVGQNLPMGSETAGWDGRFRNEKLPVGTYTYLATIQFFDGVIQTYTGSILLIR